MPRTAPGWAGRGDGYDVPITAYPESDQRALIEYSLRLMSEHGLARPTTFRAGGQFANEATLRTLASLGFVADASAVPAGAFGRLPPVSSTHLTLPTIHSVSISVVAVSLKKKKLFNACDRVPL